MMMVSEKDLVKHLKETGNAGPKVSIPSGLLPNASNIAKEEYDKMVCKYAYSNPAENLRL